MIVCAVLACGEPGLPDSPPIAEIAERVHEILIIDDRLERVEDFAHLLRGLPKSPQAALEVVAGYDESFIDRGDIELVLVAEWWAPFDTEAALDWSRSAWRAEHPRVAYAVLRSVARLDPQIAIDAYHNMAVGRDGYRAYLQPIIVGWHESGWPGLIPFIIGQPTNELQQLAFGTLARLQVLSLGPEKAMEWAEEITTNEAESFRRQILQRVAASVTEIEPRLAADWAEELILHEGASETLLRRVAGRWSRREPEAAFAWLMRFPATQHQQQAVSQTFGLWMGRSLEDAEHWLLEQGDQVG
ncbi:MAG: hypothetical protein VCB25_09960, partial [Myxococcota bacterium]